MSLLLSLALRYTPQLIIAGVLLACMGGLFHAGALHERAAWQARAAAAQVAARAAERDIAAIGYHAEATALAAAQQQREKADDELAKLHGLLAHQQRCPVSRALVRVLDGVAAVPAIAQSAALTGAAAASVAPDAGDDAATSNAAAAAGPAALSAAAAAVDATVDVSAVLDNCAWNRLNVAEPNARQITALQQFYQQLQQRYSSHR